MKINTNLVAPIKFHVNHSIFVLLISSLFAVIILFKNINRIQEYTWNNVLANLLLVLIFTFSWIDYIAKNIQRRVYVEINDHEVLYRATWVKLSLPLEAITQHEVFYSGKNNSLENLGIYSSVPAVVSGWQLMARLNTMGKYALTIPIHSLSKQAREQIYQYFPPITL